MNVQLSTSLPQTDALLMVHTGTTFDPTQYDVAFPTDLAAEVSYYFEEKFFKGEDGNVLRTFPADEKVKQLILVGTDKGTDRAELREAVEKGAKVARAGGAKTITVLIPTTSCLRMAIGGVFAQNYTFTLAEKPKHEEMTNLTLWTGRTLSEDLLKEQVATAAGEALTRYMVDMPANKMAPKDMAKEAKTVAAMNEKIMLKVLGEKELLAENCHAMLGVGQGSDEESQMVIFEYMGAGDDSAPMVFIGKGVSYDTGGYNLKPTGHIETMKCDMGGAATVVGLMRWVADVSPKVNIVGILGCVENMISGGAYKPGDIIGSRSGKTIKVTNTDAEGRLVLADCLHYACEKYKPAQLFDAATLTGAVTVALGDQWTGIMSYDDELVQTVEDAAVMEGEAYWRLPLSAYHLKKTKGDICDLLNWTKGVRMGSSMAAAFLSNFVTEGTPWVHFDIAGTAYNGKYDHGNEEGATGTLVRTWKQMVLMAEKK